MRVDINSDIGESYGAWRLGDDAAIVHVISSANVACGFHAGDPTTIRETCDAAVGAGVRIGAQVSYPDVRGFGRRFVDVPPVELADDVVYQIGALDALARTVGGQVSYVKPHGALYNAVGTHEEQAAAVAAAVRAFDPSLPVLGLPGSALLREASDLGLTTVVEAFADRGYLADGSLVPRAHAGAVLTDPDVIATRVVSMVVDSQVTAVDGSMITTHPESVCVHGDTPGAVAIAHAVRAALDDAGVSVEPFGT